MKTRKYYLLRWIGHQNWIRYGIRNRIISFFCHPETVNSYEFDVDYFGFQYNGNLNDFIDWNVYFFGAYEKAELFLLSDLAMEKKNAIFLDVGANTGQHSLFMSSYCKQVHSFEPFDGVSIKLDQKIKRNNLNNIKIHHVGLGDQTEEIEYFAPVGCNAGMGTFVNEHGETNKKLVGKLKVVLGDEYVTSVGIENISLIKIDVEGFEKAVLIGLKESLYKYRPIIMMEFSNHTRTSFEDSRALHAVLPDGYIIKQIIAEKPIGFFFNKQGYELVDFDFEHSGGNIICAPQ